MDFTIDLMNMRIHFDGSRLASGVYLCRLSTPEGSLTRPMTLIKYEADDNIVPLPCELTPVNNTARILSNPGLFF
jgi:hypothetical protein